MELDICLMVAIILCAYRNSVLCIRSSELRTVTNRTERALSFPEGSTVGIFAAIAVPISRLQNDVFVSYNFEANYNSPTSATDLTNPLERLDIPDTRKMHKRNAMEHIQRILTRSRMYRLIETKLTAYGFEGHPCLLRMICEAAETPLGIVNGVLGDVTHIILTPSTSLYERLPDIYYEAEIIGTMGACDVFQSSCPISILNVISIFH